MDAVSAVPVRGNCRGFSGNLEGTCAGHHLRPIQQHLALCSVGRGAWIQSGNPAGNLEGTCAGHRLHPLQRHSSTPMAIAGPTLGNRRGLSWYPEASMATAGPTLGNNRGGLSRSPEAMRRTAYLPNPAAPRPLRDKGVVIQAGATSQNRGGSSSVEPQHTLLCSTPCCVESRAGGQQPRPRAAHRGPAPPPRSARSRSGPPSGRGGPPPGTWGTSGSCLQARLGGPHVWRHILRAEEEQTNCSMPSSASG